MFLYLLVISRMKEVDVDKEGTNKILLVRNKGHFYAISAKCTHYGAPLGKGE